MVAILQVIIPDLGGSRSGLTLCRRVARRRTAGENLPHPRLRCQPGDDQCGQGQHGAMEQALISTPVKDLQNPIELLRVVHSFDPCLACSVHLVRPGKKAEVCRVDVTAGA